LFKKLALANYAALYVDRIYEDPASANGASLALATFAFAWQIYFDFSAYTDMARGAARIMGFKLSLNFKNPYTSSSLSEFWSRWHISLSTWFRDYVYYPLGGNKKGTKRTHINLLSVFIISGLWHGAAWTFLAWGLLHGAGLTAEKALSNVKFTKISLPRWVKIGVTFLLVCGGWIFFRAESIDEALLIYRKIFSLEWNDPQFPLFLLVMIGSVWTYQLLFETKLKKVLTENWIRVPILLGMIIYLFFCSSEGDQFIYFQF
ncbi:MAG: MBOAT family protein, partial [Akkermansiaceae bacterium]|nr:MBOAT family protein [Akkermansiaceae bacterium]